jgi:hypothetical protein
VNKLYPVKQIFLSLFLLTLPAALHAQVPKSNHVVVVLEENHSYSSVVGSSAMPYFNSLASQNVLATQYYANTHPSIGNYLELTAGQIITNNDGYTATISADNIVRHMLTAAKTWKSYAQSLPSVGYTGGDVYPYIRHHNPLSYFSDVVNSSVQRLNLVPFTHFATDLSNNQLSGVPAGRNPDHPVRRKLQHRHSARRRARCCPDVRPQGQEGLQVHHPIPTPEPVAHRDGCSWHEHLSWSSSDGGRYG